MTIILPVTKRDESKTVKALRANGELPAVVYGPKQTSVSIALEVKVFEKTLKEAGESTVLELSGLEAPIDVLIKDVAFDPVKKIFTHVDFYAVEKGKLMTTNVHIEFVGEAPVEESGQGSVTKVLHEVMVTAKPDDLPAHIDVDISVLKTVSDKIHIKDIKLPVGVTIDADPEESVAVVSAARKAEEEEDGVEAVDMSSIEVEAKGKTEETEDKE